MLNGSSFVRRVQEILPERALRADPARLQKAVRGFHRVHGQNLRIHDPPEQLFPGMYSAGVVVD